MKFCNMAIKLDAMKNMLYEAAWNADTNLGGDVCLLYTSDAADE